MNFFSHAHVACWQSTLPAFVLGSMLPDFASMARARLIRVEDPEMARGVELHHKTDWVFHGAPDFLALCRQATDELSRAGVPMAPSRAVAHVGTEIVLDGVLVGDGQTRQAFKDAVRAGAPDSLGPAIVFAKDDGSRRWEELRARIEGWGVPEEAPGPEEVAERVRRTLCRRPRLALRDDDVPIIRRWLGSHEEQVRRRASSLFDAVREGLA